jgi:hypothetical protein
VSEPGVLSRSALRVGAVRGRYFRENFAQGGIDLGQIIPELVTNADAAIAASGREHGRIELSFTQPDPAFLREWRAQTRALGVPALGEWRWEVRCRDDGIGVNAAAVDRRLGALGELPEHDGAQRGLFGRGLRDVWLAQGAGRIEGARDARRVESWFFPAAGDDPYAYLHVRDQEARDAAAYTLVTVPLAAGRLPADGRLRILVSQLVQLRPVLEDPGRELVLTLASGTVQVVRYPAPQPDLERPILFDDVVDVAAGVTARVTVRRSAQVFSAGMSRATRLGGLVVRSGRAAHESTLGSHEGRPGTRQLYGEVRCDALEELQRAALDSRRPQVVVRVDRSGLNEAHPVVRALYAAIDRVLAPIVADEERRQSARTIRPTNALRARDQVGLRALNDALRNAFDTPGKAAFQPSAQPAEKPPAISEEIDPAVAPAVAPAGGDTDQPSTVPATPEPVAPLRFKQVLVRLHPGERRGVSLLIDPAEIAPGIPVQIAADSGLTLTLHHATVPEPVRGGWSRLDANLRCRVSCDPGARLSVLADAAGHSAELVVLVVRHHASGWVREIARNDDDHDTDATFDPETGVVTVYEGRREFKALEKAARRAGLPKARIREYLPYRMLEVEVAANAVYTWAAQQILARRLAEERPSDPVEYAASVHHQTQALRYRAHDKLMRAFLDDDVFDGHIRSTPPPRQRQTSLLDPPPPQM